MHPADVVSLIGALIDIKNEIAMLRADLRDVGKLLDPSTSWTRAGPQPIKIKDEPGSETLGEETLGDA